MESIDEKSQNYAYKKVRESFPTLRGNAFQLIKLIVKSAYIQGAEFTSSENIGKSAKEYANNRVSENLLNIQKLRKIYYL